MRVLVLSTATAATLAAGVIAVHPALSFTASLIGTAALLLCGAALLTVLASHIRRTETRYRASMPPDQRRRTDLRWNHR
ncbi:hypothetical protein GCM10027187_39660 [Streptosporangium sandarakinum]|uniref:Uncharacterized protein n=1 Tax=Streptosporangium sandarakinum TaxID=1260955 RepID=A0A852VBD1_9ACTN|nr:hypothetical protein [Streptosporangium sandarakinum]NYF44543.1 hypothetical protein [Streptosporangium sandarakinum]